MYFFDHRIIWIRIVWIEAVLFRDFVSKWAAFSFRISLETIKIKIACLGYLISAAA